MYDFETPMWSQIFASIFLMVNGAEWLALSMKPTFSLLSENRLIALRLSDRRLASRWVLSHLGRSTRRTIAISLAIFQALQGVGVLIFALFFNNMHTLNGLILLGALVVHLTLCNTVAYGLEGADQVISITLFALAIIHLLPNSTLIVEGFVSVQVVLSYVIAGAAKLKASEWRCGIAIMKVLSTKSFGIGKRQWNPIERKLATFLGILIITYEISWSLSLYSPKVLIFFCISGIIFHFSNAVVMGLNQFPWAFLSTYPLLLSFRSSWPM